MKSVAQQLSENVDLGKHRLNRDEKKGVVAMSSNATPRFRGKVRDDYMELIQTFPLTSIRSQEQLDAAQEFMDELFAESKLSRGEEMYLDALSDLIATYEDEHVTIEPASDADMLRHFMEAKGKTQADLHRETGISKSSLSEVLSDKKCFSRQMIRKLTDYFDVNVSVLASNL